MKQTKQAHPREIQKAPRVKPIKTEIVASVIEKTLGKAKEKKRPSKNKPMVLNPFTSPIWPIDQIPVGFMDNLSKLDQKHLLLGINNVTKAFEKQTKIGLVIFADAEHQTHPKMMTEHIKILCSMHDVPFLNLTCPVKDLSQIFKIKSLVVLAVKMEDSNENQVNFIKKYAPTRNITLDWLKNTDYKPLSMGTMEKKRKTE